MTFKLYILILCFALVNGYFINKTNKEDYLSTKRRHVYIVEPDNSITVENIPDSSDSDSVYPDSSGSDSKYPDSSGSYSKYPDSSGSDSEYYPDSSGPDSKYPDSSSSYLKYPDSSGSDSEYYPDSSGSDSKYPYSSGSDSEYYPDSSGSDLKYPDSSGSDLKYPDSSGSDSEYYPDSSGSDSKYPDSSVSDSLHPDSSEEPTSKSSSEEISTTTNPRTECPEGQSSLYEKDLMAMIVFFAQQMNFTENLNASYYETAVEFSDAGLKSIKDFIMKFENRPKHLDHVIEDLVKTRSEIVEPLVRKVVSKRPEFDSLSQIHQKHTETSQALLNKLKKSKKICELNCPTEYRKVYKRSVSAKKTASQDVYYCANVKEVSVKIRSELKDFQNTFAQDLRSMVVNSHSTHEKQIGEMKTKLKEAAVKEFGATMYDILSLQDEYNHFIELVQGENGIENVESQLSEIRKNNLEIDFKTEQLKTDVEKYRKHCLACDINQNWRLRRDASQQWRDSKDVSTDVLARLLTDYLMNTKNQFESDHANLLEELNVMLSDQDEFVQFAVGKLEPIKESVKKDLVNEEGELNYLKSLAPEALIEDLSKLNQDTSSLNRELDEALDFIHEVIQ